MSDRETEMLKLRARLEAEGYIWIDGWGPMTRSEIEEICNLGNLTPCEETIKE